MINNKWLQLYKHIKQNHSGLLPSITFSGLLIKKVELLKEQFSDLNTTDNPQHNDWLEHEAFTSVFSNLIRNMTVSKTDIDFLYETLMAAQLCQLALSIVNNHKQVLETDDLAFKTGVIYQKLGDYEHSKEKLEEALSINPLNDQAACYLGLNYMYTGETEHSISLLKKSIEINPNNAAGYQNLAGLYYQESEFEKSAELCEGVFVLNKSITAAYITAISSYLALNNIGYAERWIQRSISNNISSMELVRLAGISAHKAERYSESIEALSHYLSVYPESFDVLAIRARSKIALGLWSELEPDLKQLLSFDAHDVWVLEQLFLTHFHTKKWSEARVVMSELKKLGGTFKITYRNEIDAINQALSIEVLEID
ncbi:tetratricopeptide repeat protein [Vibrio kyushuensis]|uniref:tetratricopeptide repeat protein n=1 Tax=Vibrio kyushuensis TaxID=2910249 RepID=UPI003D1294BE